MQTVMEGGGGGVEDRRIAWGQWKFIWERLAQSSFISSRLMNSTRQFSLGPRSAQSTLIQDIET